MTRERFIIGLLAFVSVVLVSVIVFDTVKLANVSGTLQTSITSQQANRVSNVARWCGGINASRDYDRAFVRSVTRGQVRYTLGDMPCAQLERATAASSK